MHLLVRQTRTQDDAQAVYDPGASSDDLVFLSFSDADLNALAAAHHAALPGLRLESLAQLRHPMSVDLLVEQVIQPARCVVIRLLGGLDYWRYGIEEVFACCMRRGIALAVVAGDGPAEDPRLACFCTVAPAMQRRLHGLLAQGGLANMRSTLALASHLAGLAEDQAGEPEPLPEAGIFELPPSGNGPLAVIVFYRSHLLSSDTRPVEALAAALAARGLSVRALYVSSLKSPAAAAIVRGFLTGWRPAVVLSATGFSARSEEDAASPLDCAGVPVLQLVLTVGDRLAWQASPRGLSQSDLAMQVVLPEFDGRLLTGAISFKAPSAADPARTINQPDADGVALAADRAAGWAHLAAKHAAARRVAIVLSDYPGLAGQIGHAVGLDSFASVAAILRLLRSAGYSLPDGLPEGLPEELPDAAQLAEALTKAEPEPFLSLDDYAEARLRLPQANNAALDGAWGAAEADPAVQAGWFTLRWLDFGGVVVAVQPDRGREADRRRSYHDADLPPRHLHVAFHLWLRRKRATDAVIHLGTHGALEWLPGKAAALSAECWPVALLRGMPVVYPFIVNNPGEAAVAKRRLGAVTIGHLTPPLRSAGSGEAAQELEHLLEEFAAADGLDRRRGALLRAEILSRAEQLGLLAECGADRAPDQEEALARLDAWLCDVKELQIRDGLHVFGQPSPARAELAAAIRAGAPGMDPPTLDRRLDACATSEAQALLAALDGKFVQPGPAAAPSRGRPDVLPTGRNLTSIDPRAIPGRSAMVLAGRMAESLLLRHRQDNGEDLRRLVIDLWASTTLRTGGEDFGLALILIGAAPIWDEGSARVSGIEILPTALLDRPRVDVTLRLSGLFRDQFEAQIALFDQAVQAIAAREEDAALNPLMHVGGGPAPIRIYGPAPGGHGAGGEAMLQDGDRDALGRAYLRASSHAYGGGLLGARDEAGFAARVAGAQAFLHQQDHAETDLLDSPDFAAHEGGFAAAAACFGNAPVLYHADTSRPERPKVRTVPEEIARIVRGRLANTAWIAGMRRHGYRGASEIARGVSVLHGFARSLQQRLDAQYELAFAATLGDAEVVQFLQECNQDAYAALRADFHDALARGLWVPRTNSASFLLDAP